MTQTAADSIMTVTPEQATSILLEAEKGRFPILLVAQPGVGKTEICQWVAEETRREFKIFNGSMADPTDFIGFPFNTDKEYVELKLYKHIFELVHTDKPTLLLIDEVLQTSPAVQAVFMPLLQERRLGNYKLPNNVWIVGATNRLCDRAGGSIVLEPLKSRFHMILHMESHLESFVAWAHKNSVHEAVISYVRTRPEVLGSFKPSVDIVNYTCPRTLVKLSELLGFSFRVDCLLPVVIGAIGPGAGAEFVGHLKMYQSIIPFENIIKDPEKVKLPDKDRPDVMYAVATMVAARSTVENFDKVVRFIKRLPKTFSVVAFNDAINKNPKLKETAAGVAWGVENQDVLFGQTS